jgi:hypothetical protein
MIGNFSELQPVTSQTPTGSFVPSSRFFPFIDPQIATYMPLGISDPQLQPPKFTYKSPSGLSLSVLQECSVEET